MIFHSILNLTTYWTSQAMRERPSRERTNTPSMFENGESKMHVDTSFHTWSMSNALPGDIHFPTNSSEIGVDSAGNAPMNEPVGEYVTKEVFCNYIKGFPCIIWMRVHNIHEHRPLWLFRCKCTANTKDSYQLYVHQPIRNLGGYCLLYTRIS